MDGGADDFVLDAGEERGRDDFSGRIRAHAAGVGAGVAVADAFVILGGWEDDVVAAGDDDEDRGFLAEETVLDEELAAGGAEFAAVEHVAHGGFGFGERGGDDDAFAGGEAVGFDHDGNCARAQVGEGRGDFAEKGGGRGGDAVLQEELFRENLGGFEARAVGFGAVDGKADFVQAVGEAEGERDFGADDDELDFFALREGDEAGDVVGGDGDAGGFEGDAGVARGAEDAGCGGRGEEGADEGVFASAGADDEKGARKRR